MNLLELLFFNRLSCAGTRRSHQPSVEVVRDVEQVGRLNWSVSGNGSRLDPFKWRGSCRPRIIPSIPEGVVRRLLRRTSEG